MPMKRAERQLPPVVAGLLDRRAYPHEVRGIELVQTHISYVLLAGAYAYKIKKPVDFGFVDYSTLERRRHFCDEEIRLNRRLCDDVYLEVVPIVAADGRVKIGGDGEALEYAVRMRRVPDERTLPALLDANRIAPDNIRGIAATIARFHEQADRSDEIAAYGGIDAVRRNIEENFEQARPYVGKTLTREQFEVIERYNGDFLTDDAGRRLAVDIDRGSGFINRLQPRRDDQRGHDTGDHERQDHPAAALENPQIV